MSDEITGPDVLQWFEAQRIQKLDWLSKFSSGPKKWPDSEIAQKQYDLRVLERLIERQTAALEARKSA